MESWHPVPAEGCTAGVGPELKKRTPHAAESLEPKWTFSQPRALRPGGAASPAESAVCLWLVNNGLNHSAPTPLEGRCGVGVNYSRSSPHGATDDTVGQEPVKSFTVFVVAF